MSKLIVMVGIPGSGKSYRAGNYAKYNDVKILSSDTYRKELFGDDRFDRLMQFGEYDRRASGTYEAEE